MKIRKILAVGVAGATALALSACTGGGGAGAAGGGGPIDTSGELTGTIKFQTWSLKNEKFTPYFEALIDEFEKEHPEVTVEWLDQPGEGYQDKILSQANSNTLPDVLNRPPDIAFPLVKAGKLLDLAEADPGLESQYNEGGWTAYSSYSGTEGTYGLPWYLGSDASWWNLAALEPYGITKDNLPATTDEWLDTAKEVATASNGKVQLVSSMPGVDTFISAGIPVMDEDGTFTFNTPEAEAIMQKYADAYAAGAMPAEALSAVEGDLEPAQAEAMDVMFDSLSKAKAAPFQWTGDMSTYFNQQIALAISGEMSAKEALDKIVDYANENRIDK
ncbi:MULTISPECIES: ABC transporter substrate-binding protein [Microbacterium]|uniref:ABC transporter substrate-binding protein n=1 Tax=Microbacterium TaxID=33882 RepID=UPI00217EC404|nr:MULTISPECIES: extracellular solute-binding protein [Microbacterium]UWF77389.1 extracellular solute-binding protein [Microbacterium neungamense]WCM55551.1 extracellular solute-binding protein [Microbacterium sp. EF45047]